MSYTDDYSGDGDLVCAGCDRFVESIDANSLCLQCSNSKNHEVVDI